MPARREQVSLKSIPTSEEYLDKIFNDSAFRLLDSGIYCIKDVAGQIVPFVANDIQRMMYEDMHTFNAVLKSRQVGSTTFWSLFLLDCALFLPNHTIGVIAPKEKLADKIRIARMLFAYNRLPTIIKKGVFIEGNNKEMLRFSNGSVIDFGSGSLRGDTYQKLMITEFGPISADNPHDAHEIMTGAENAVHLGIGKKRAKHLIVYESTAKQFRGAFVEMARLGLSNSNLEKLNPLQPKLLFYSWNMDSKCATNDKLDPPLTEEEQKVIDYWADEGFTASVDQINFYFAKRRRLGAHNIFSEYPTFPQEALEAPAAGAIWARQIQEAKQGGRMIEGLYDPRKPVYTGWDLGIDDPTSIWFAQYTPRGKGEDDYIDFIDFVEDNDVGLYKFVDFLKTRAAHQRYAYKEHLFPHDLATREMVSGMSRRSLIIKAGLSPPPRIMSKTDEEDQLMIASEAFPRIRFDPVKCAKGIEHLRFHSRQYDRQYDDYAGKLRHDKHSHAASAFKTILLYMAKMKLPEYTPVSPTSTDIII